MRLEEVDARTILDAVQTYAAIAWDGAGPRAVAALAPARTRDEALAQFTREVRPGDMQRYWLRLGNRRYPFMKLVFQELLIKGSFFFAVDTHDELEIKDSVPDYDAWLALKSFNADLKERIEKAWQERGIPTIASLVEEVERAAPPLPREVEATAPMILVVDDDASLQRCARTILEREGYRTRGAVSGEEALEAMTDERPALILSDLEMGGMSGLDLARRVRESPELAPVPFILATAATVGSTNFRVIDGFLVKPYDASVLLTFVGRHLKR